VPDRRERPNQPSEPERAGPRELPAPAIPFDVLRCSWPLPVEQGGQGWASEPEWSAPSMRPGPRPEWRWLNGELCWTIDWREFFSVATLTRGGRSGEMRGFHVVFEIQIARAGELVFWADDGCIVRRDGRVVHADRAAHPLQRHTLRVDAGDRLEIAQWQACGDWIWGAWLGPLAATATATVAATLAAHLPTVLLRMRQPSGPALKVFTSAQSPLRLAATVYSCILNGYAPPAVYLFGEHQWTADSRRFIEQALPFATIVPTTDVVAALAALGQPLLARRAIEHWYIMKACSSLLFPPAECCNLDDDMLVLGPVHDALTAFQSCDLVFQQNADWSAAYQATWPDLAADCPQPWATGSLNAGLYWVRPVIDERSLAAAAARAEPVPASPWYWEQGLIAAAYARSRCCGLPTQRYFYPAFDGLPGGVLGYDYLSNPCRFATIHFGGLPRKPDDADISVILPALLAERPPAEVTKDRG
jgi:hypothetical protein